MQLVGILAGVAFIAGFAQLSFQLDWNELRIPVTGQTFAVLVAGMLFGIKRAFVVVMLYLLVGGLGFPVFAEGGHGWQVFQKGSGGFLIGFLFGAMVVGWLGDRGWRRSFPKALVAMTLGTATIMAFGLLRLTWLYGGWKALEYGFYPFVGGAVVKILLGAVVVWLWERLNFGRALS